MTEPETKLQKYSAPALEKGLDILELLSLSQTELTLSQVATGVGRSKSEIFRMMIVLEERGFIARDGSDGYRLTDRMGQLGARRAVNNRLAEIAAPVLADLAEDVNLSCHLSIMDDTGLVAIAQAGAASGYGISVPVGHRTALADAAAGMCFLAFTRDEDRRDRLVKELTRTSGSASALTEEVSACRTRLVARRIAGTSPIAELATPVIGMSSGQTVAAITVPFFGNAAEEDWLDRVTTALTRAGRNLHERLGLLLPQL